MINKSRSELRLDQITYPSWRFWAWTRGGWHGDNVETTLCGEEEGEEEETVMGECKKRVEVSQKSSFIYIEGWVTKDVFPGAKVSPQVDGNRPIRRAGGAPVSFL